LRKPKDWKLRNSKDRILRENYKSRYVKKWKGNKNKEKPYLNKNPQILLSAIMLRDKLKSKQQMQNL
jgi:hypothetical protein